MGVAFEMTAAASNRLLVSSNRARTPFAGIKKCPSSYVSLSLTSPNTRWLLAWTKPKVRAAGRILAMETFTGDRLFRAEFKNRAVRPQPRTLATPSAAGRTTPRPKTTSEFIIPSVALPRLLAPLGTHTSFSFLLS